VHPGHVDAPRYTGSHAAFAPFAPMPGPHPFPHHAALPGFCHSCCHPKTRCCCACRECRKEAKDLLVTPARAAGKTLDLPAYAEHVGTHYLKTFVAGHAAAEAAPKPDGIGGAFIGGGCCVHLSIEYAPATPTSESAVSVFVGDTEGTVMSWTKTTQPGTGYQIKEGIITTKPGAGLIVLVAQMTARVRWCEIFSC
jgi:hypothetical protein